MKRTPSQNNALHLFCDRLAETLNDMGLEMKVVLKPTYQLWWTKDSVKNHLWKPIQKAMYQTESTKDLTKQEQIDKIHSIIMRELGEKFGVEYIKFPSDEEYQLLKIRYPK